MQSVSTLSLPHWPNDDGPWRSGWQRIEVIGDWHDHDLLLDALDDLDPVNITITNRFVAIYEFHGDTDMVLFRFNYPDIEGLTWDIDDRVACQDPCDDPDATEEQIESDGQGVTLSMATVHMIDIRNEATYRELDAALRRRVSDLLGDLPLIKFISRRSS
jgi:hypothetical protein